MTSRIAVLASGGGTNLQAILDYLAGLGTNVDSRVVLVASDRADAGALERARRDGIEALRLTSEERGDRLPWILDDRRIDIVALAGYLRLVPAEVTRRWRGRIVNVHPALLPAFGGQGMYGRRVHEAVLRAGVRVTGPTVHFVDEQYDRGPIIAQWPVPVAESDTPDSLAARVLRAEHALYPRVLRALAEGRVRLGDDGSVRGLFDLAIGPRAAFAPTLTDSAIAHALDSLLSH